MVYLCFSTDFLIEEADSWRGECWSMIRERQECTFLFLTKRIERFMDCIPDDWGEGYDNVVVCCTIENQKNADKKLSIFKMLPISINVSQRSQCSKEQIWKSILTIYGVNDFSEGFIQMTIILVIMGLFDRFFIDWYWVGHTKAWLIPGTEDLKPYIPVKVLVRKWIGTLVVYPLIALLMAKIMTFIVQACEI